MFRILHVDDDELIRTAFKRMLKDYRVTSVASFDEALITIGIDGVFDVIVSDYDIGYPNGMDLWWWVKDNRPDLHERFMFVTSVEAPTMFEGIWLEKPCSKSQLLAAIHKLIHDKGVLCSCSTSHGCSSTTS